MLDLNYLRKNKEHVLQKYKERGTATSLEELLILDAERRKCIVEADDLKHLRNEVSKEIGFMQKEGKLPQEKIAYMKEVSNSIKELDITLSEIGKKIDAILLVLPNVPHVSVPAGKDASENKEIRCWGTAPNFNFKPRTHIDLGTALRILDFERAAKIAQTRFTLSKGAGALLERALINFMLDIHTREHNYIEVLPPFLVNQNSMQGTGQLPKFDVDLFRIEDPLLYLIPTAEVPVTNIFNNEILTMDQLPISLCAYSPCFRREAGTYGAETRGLIRQHQFNKVELVKIVLPDKSYEALELLTHHAERILQKLNLHYRTISLCTGDLGFASAKTYDIEVWCPGQDAFVEISSCSNFEDFQARRTNIKYKPGLKSKPEYVHTLNGSGLAIGRTVVAIIENYQQEDGTIVIPEALRSYMNGLQLIEPNPQLF